MRFPDPPAWGMAAGLVGKGLVFAAITLFALSILTALLRKEKPAARCFTLGTIAVVCAFGVHVLLLMARQYQYAYVWANTSNELAEVYRFSAAWAAQEGSFLLWTLTSAVIAAIVARRTGQYRLVFTVVCSAALIFMAAILAYESPFHLIRLTEADKEILAPGQAMVLPPDGRGLNPTLANYWMAIHPWVIFIGFGSLLSVFAFAASAAWSKSLSAWVPLVRPLAIFTMLILGIGLTMGGLWAYETLGWGGFWAWDPVENVSLVPFVAAAVLVHGLFIQKNRERWDRLNILLGLLPFVWFVYGTYLTRSGALTAVSVHSFAEMNEGAKWILFSLVGASAAGGVYLAARAFKVRIDQGTKPRGDRLAGMTIGMALLYGIGLMAAFGMSYPFLGVILKKPQQIVPESAYNFVVAFPFVPVLLLMAVVPFLGWTKTAQERGKTLGNVFFASVLIFGIGTFTLVKTGLTLDGFERMPAQQLVVFYLLVFVCLFAIVANAYRLIERLRAKSGGVGAFLTHAGVAILLLGLIVSRAFEKTDFDGVTRTQPGRLALLPNRTYLASIERLPTPEQLNDPANRLEFLLREETGDAELRVRPNFYYHIQGDEAMPVTRPDIVRRPLYDLYFVVRPPETELVDEMSLSPGESGESGPFTIRYVEKTQTGEPGRAGTRFGARVVLSIGGADYDAHPEIEITGSGTAQRPAEIEELGVRIELRRLMAGTGAATLSIVSPELIFPVELFFKPLTILVWIGAGLMTIGGALSIRAALRRG